MRHTLHIGNNLEVLPTLPDNSVEAIVTDPPYGLVFMGKDWDKDVPGPDTWRECLRVLKPGGHLLAFAGTRTQHKMATAIELAGFEVRDLIAWVYGSGFPKSLDVSKALDKGQGENRNRMLQFTAWMRGTGITAEQINAATQSNMASHYLTDKSQPLIATAEMFDKMRPFLPEVPEYIERLVAERTGIEWTDYVKRKVIESKQMRDFSEVRIAITASAGDFDEKARREVAITTPFNINAAKWDGWGTALKPAMEPITVARKPLEGTVAANVLKHGTGAINIDACRVEHNEDLSVERMPKQMDTNGQGWGFKSVSRGLDGRWPANLIHDGSEDPVSLMGDAARFFYCPKANKKDRDEGCEEMPEVRESDREKDNGIGGDNPRNRTNNPRKNHHPTVKPTDLMRYLCRLVTPPGGTVLDPFTGSGSTGKAAILEGFNFIGIELSPEYAAIAEARIRAAYKPDEA